MRIIAVFLCASIAFAMGVPTSAAESSAEQRSRFQRLFDTNDANRDGFVSLDEFQARSAEVFKNIDTNGDGKVSPEEMKAYHQKQFQKVMEQQRRDEMNEN